MVVIFWTEQVFTDKILRVPPKCYLCSEDEVDLQNQNNLTIWPLCCANKSGYALMACIPLFSIDFLIAAGVTTEHPFLVNSAQILNPRNTATIQSSVIHIRIWILEGMLKCMDVCFPHIILFFEIHCCNAL